MVAKPIKPINLTELRRSIEALKEYRTAQAVAYYGVDKPVEEVEEWVPMDRLLLIADATHEHIEVGLRAADGSAETKFVKWAGCRFWASVTNPWRWTNA